MDENKPQLQSSLGDIASTKNKKERSWNNGYMAFGQVLKVYPKRYTADVMIFHTHDKIRSLGTEEGRHSCKIGVGSAGFSELHGRPYGEICPLHAGDIVLVAFLKNTKEHPVIIGVFHNTSEDLGDSNYRNILNNYHSTETAGDIENYLSISPIQDFKFIDHFGNIEIASHTKSFFVAKEKGIDDEGFDFEDLSVKSNTTRKQREESPDSINTKYGGKNYKYYNRDMTEEEKKMRPLSETVHVEEKYSKPKKYLLCFRDSFYDSVTNWLKLIVDAAKTSFRLIKFQQDTNTSTMFELDEFGTVKLKRQLDSRKLFDPKVEQTADNMGQNPSKVFSEISMLADGTIIVQTLDKTNPQETKDGTMPYPTTTIVIEPMGGNVVLQTKSAMMVSAEKGINFSSKAGIDITSEQGVNISSKSGVNIASEKGIDMASPNVDVTGAVGITGSMDMAGDTNIVGNTAITGKALVNGRKAIVQGDRDSRGHRSYSHYGSALQSICESFIRKRLMANMSVNLAPACSILGMVNSSAGGFSGMKWAGKWGGDASIMKNGGCFGDIMKWSDKNKKMLEDFCKKAGMSTNSIAAQLEFLQSKTGGLGIDLNKIQGVVKDGTAAIDTVVNSVNELYNKLEKLNNIEDDVKSTIQQSVDKLAGNIVGSISNFNISSEMKKVLQEALPIGSPAIKSSSLSPNYSDDGDDPRVMLDISKIIHEGNVRKETRTKKDVTYDLYIESSIEDALSHMNQYFNNDLLEEVAKIERRIDAKMNCNSVQYARTNNKHYINIGGKEYYKSSPLQNKEQYYDKLVKRFIYSTCEKMLQRANSSWSYHNLFD